jgi:hypothetical protein
MVSHAYNPSYSGGRNQEDHGFRPAQVSDLQDPISNNKSEVQWQCTPVILAIQEA